MCRKLFTCHLWTYTTAENKKVTFKFVEGGSVHSLPWTELLTMDETPFVSIDDVTEGMNVMAPWYDDDSITIQHAQAVIVGQGEYVLSPLPCMY